MGTGSFVAIVGRPNVGKSTLFNRLIQKKTAIEEKVPGVTRDRLYGRAEWRGREFTVIDTGGITMAEDMTLKDEIQHQTELAIEQSALILLIVDAKSGFTPFDEEIAGMLRKAQKEVVLVVNKVDSYRDKGAAYPFYKLGLGEPLSISAQHGLNTGDLLDMILDKISGQPADPYPAEAIKVAVVGRPNVGKSSLVNKLINEERVIVNDLPGTTRDAVDTFFERNNNTFIFIDTAGMRRKGNVKEALEYYSVLRSLRAIEKADVVLLLLDATEDFAEQDQRIAGYIHEAGCGMIFVVNKWDLIKKDGATHRKYCEELTLKFNFARYASSLFVSAKTGQRTHSLFPLIEKVNKERDKKISTSIYNKFLEDVTAVNPPPLMKGKQLKIYYGTQIGVKPPTFTLFVNDSSFFHFSYRRYLENRMREAFGFEGTPLRIKLRQKSNRK